MVLPSSSCLVVILIIGILAAIAIPSFLSQKGKAYDASAKELARTAETTAETYATEHEGKYEFKAPAELQAIEPSIPIAAGKGEAYLKTAAGTANTYEVTAVAVSTEDEFTIKREAGGNIVRKCVLGKGQTNRAGCPASGEW